MSKIEISVTDTAYGARGDGVHDDAPAIQAAIDAAYKLGAARIIIPRGIYSLSKTLKMYGMDIAVIGEDGVKLLINFHFTGPNSTGVGMWIAPTFDSTFYYPAQPVTGDTIIFNSPVPFRPGETLFLTNGRGSMLHIEKQLQGSIVDPAAFNELAPCEYVDVLSVAQVGTQYVVKLREAVIGADEYANVSPGGSPTESFMHVRRFSLPCEKVSVQNVDFDFGDASGDCSLVAYYARNATIQNVRVFRQPNVAGGRGGIGIVGSMNVLAENISSPLSIGLNSSRQATIRRCHISSVSLEEGVTDSVIAHNTIRTTAIGIRINDNPCRRNHIDGNVVLGGATNFGAIGLWEGSQNIVSGNVMAMGASNSAWTGGRGNIFVGNIGDSFGDFTKSNRSFGNSWDAPADN